MGSQLIVSFRKFQRLLVTVLLLLVVATVTAPARAGSSISVVSNPAQGNPYEVQENQDSTLTYNLTYSVGPNSEGVTPSVNSITVTFTVNNGGTIKESGSSTWTETLTQNRYSPMGLSCEASGPSDGFYSVTCKATLNLSDGTSFSSNTASDVFLVANMTVNVSGPPYVIIDNSNPYDNSPVDSTYTASVQGAPDPSAIVYEWTVSSNVNALTALSGPQPTLSVDGAGPEGGGNITCAVICDGSNQSGSKQVTVQDEYVSKMNPPATLVYGSWTELPPVQIEPASGGVPLSWTVTGLISATIGVTVSGGFNAGFVAAQVGGTVAATSTLSISATQRVLQHSSLPQVAATSTLSISATATLPNPIPNTTYAEWVRTIRNDLTGTETQWGPSGIVKTGQINQWSWASGDYDLELGGGRIAPPS